MEGEPFAPSSSPAAASPMTALLSGVAGRTILHVGEAPMLNEDTDILVRVLFAAQNPPDTFVVTGPNARPGCGIGSDFAGQVIALHGSPDNGVAVGDRVCGMICGGQDGVPGAFATVVAVSSKLVVRVPHEVDLAQASTLGMSLWTALHAMYFHMDLVLPYSHTPPTSDLLIWGGASSCGMFAIQLAKASGYRVVATASRANHSLVKSLGATEVFDYRDEEVVQLIRASYPGIALALDCVSTQETIESCINALGHDGGLVHHLMPAPPAFVNPRADCVTHKFALVFTMLGRPIPWATYLFDPLPSLESMQKERARAERQWLDYDCGLLYRLLIDGKLSPLPIVVLNQGGLARVERFLTGKDSNGPRGGKVVHQVDAHRG